MSRQPNFTDQQLSLIRRKPRPPVGSTHKFQQGRVRVADGVVMSPLAGGPDSLLSPFLESGVAEEKRW